MSHLFQIPECLRLIFTHLKDDRTSLHSCILVNRLWCIICIDILWSEPFHLLYTCNKNPCVCSLAKRYLQASNLLKTLLSCFIQQNPTLFHKNIIYSSITSPLFNYVKYLRILNLHELNMAVQDWWINHKNPQKRTLAKIKIPGSNQSLKTNQTKKTKKTNQNNQNNQNNISQKKLTKKSNNNNKKNDGKRYVTSGDCVTILQTQVAPFGLIGSSSETCYNISSDSLRQRMAIIICRLYMSNSRSIEQISFDFRFALNDFVNQNSCATFMLSKNSLDQRYTFVDEYLNFPTYPGSNNCLSKLTKLVCTTRHRKADLLLSLANNCHLIKYLEIRVDYDIDFSPVTPTPNKGLMQESLSLTKLIQEQKCLDHMELQKCSVGLEEIINALKTQTHCLNSLHLNELNFSNIYLLRQLTKFKNLENLEFESCKFPKTEIVSPSLKYEFKLSTLVKLKINQTEINNDIIELIIGGCTSNLQQLELGNLFSTKNDSNFMYGNVIGLMAERFHNLTYIKTVLEEKQQIPQVISLFLNCPNLETVIFCQEVKSLNVFDTNDLLEALGKNGLPSTLKHFGLYGKNWTFTCIALEFLLTPPIYCNSCPNFKLEILGSLFFTNIHIDSIIKMNKSHKIINELIITKTIYNDLDIQKLRELQINVQVI
ncbi:6685_t:CDS:1 [Diversispora eburnea]|uniref:6685_t:CDS:1 n=1 Tax=Diversispora eburnea TaxID=1213867 RepID=A0A9N8V5N8_9GLOM|nr:6685_t:CDS:1 [Diversispora eburnea]